MKHKAQIYSVKYHHAVIRLWYATCQCGWEMRVDPSIDGHYGRDTWDAAFALGIAHLQNADLKERLKA